MDSQFRGKGYAKVLLSLTLKNCSYDYKYAFDWIHEHNTLSIKTSESIGMKMIGRLYVKGVMRNLVDDPNGDNRIYKYIKNE